MQGIVVSLIPVEMGYAFAAHTVALGFNAAHTIALGFSASLGLYADDAMGLYVAFVNRKFREVSVTPSIFRHLGGHDGVAYHRGVFHGLDATGHA